MSAERHTRAIQTINAADCHWFRQAICSPAKSAKQAAYFKHNANSNSNSLAAGLLLLFCFTNERKQQDWPVPARRPLTFIHGLCVEQVCLTGFCSPLIEDFDALLNLDNLTPISLSADCSFAAVAGLAQRPAIKVGGSRTDRDQISNQTK